MTIEAICSMVDGLPGNYMVFAYAGGALQFLHHTCRVEMLTGYTAEEARLVTSPYDIVLEDDKPMIRHALAAYMQDPEQAETDLLFRMIHKVNGFIWIHMLIKKYAVVDGKQIVLAILVDVTKETGISYALMDASDRYICVIEKATKRILYGNDKFYGLIDSSPAQAVGKHCYQLLCKVLAMRDNDNCLCYSSLNADPPIETYNPLKKMHLTITGREVVWGEYNAYVFYMTDITEKKRQEEELRDSQKRFEVALENSELMVWEYDMVNHRCITSQKATSDYNIPLIIENYPESLFETGHTPPETIAQIKDVQRRLQNGETGFSVERRTIDKNGKSNWQKVEYTLECDENGKPLRAIVCGLDITKQKELEQKYEEQMEYRNKFAQNALFSARLDLTSNTLLDHTCTEPLFEEISSRSTSAADFLQAFFPLLTFNKSSDITPERLTLPSLRRAFEMGQYQFHVSCFCPSLSRYLNVNFSMYQNPGTRHLEVFYIVADITDNMLRQKALSAVASDGYDFVSLIDVHTGLASIVASSPEAALPPMPENGKIDYDQTILSFARSIRSSYKTESDYHAVSDGMTLSAIIKKLQTQSVYEFNCRARHGENEMRTFRLRFFYVDDTHSHIIYTRSNITKAVLEEQAVQQKLEKALKDAKEANQAKTDFLARMSHDMRTPMNAIIGLSALTLDEVHNPGAVQDNMAKIRASSDFLLGLVNDILDMAKIEDGSVVLKPEPYTYYEFLSNMRTMFQPQCEAKGITLTFKEPKINPMIRVDKLRVNQIFFNIFSNAVKYTPAGGSIGYTIENLVFEDHFVSLDYVIADTGIGMSEAFQQHLFEPFMQENGEATPELQGTGLGLSITKQLVDLMGGTIAITSKQGVGTTVRVHFRFECLSQDVDFDEKPQKATEAGSESCLIGKRVLLAEDHPLNAQIAKKLLEKKSMIVYHAENGQLAVDAFKASPDGFFDLVLMDIRMPVMDGLTAVKTIRALHRPDARTVPILAMSANAYDEDIQKSLAAGMNDHLAKPVNPATLYQALAKYLSR